MPRRDVGLKMLRTAENMRALLAENDVLTAELQCTDTKYTLYAALRAHWETYGALPLWGGSRRCSGKFNSAVSETTQDSSVVAR